MQAPKNGIFYVIDRTNGKFISGDPFVYVNWASGIDPVTGRPNFRDDVHYETVNTDVSPNYNGGHNWHPMAFNPTLNLVFIPARENASNYGHDPNWKYNQKGFGTGNGWNLAIGKDESKPTNNDPKTKSFPRGMLIAWDPVKRKEVWRVPQSADWNGGLLATASNLLFQGTAEGNFIAYDATNGHIMWEANLGGGVIAPPVTYTIDGTQYVSVLAGWGGGYGMKKKFAPIQQGRLYTFALNGKTAFPTYQQSTKKEITEIPFTATASELKHGAEIFDRYCATCHVINEGGGGLAPDLAYSTKATHEGFLSIVHKGAYLPLGMPKFGDRLSEDDVKQVEKFILSKSKK